MPVVIANIDEVPFLEPVLRPDGSKYVPGLGVIKTGTKGRTKFLGNDETGPWIYVLERPAGDVIPRHKHVADRVEYLIEGEIEWREDDGSVTTYGPGTVSFVTRGTEYEYTVKRDARILLWFAARPGFLG
jgi:quercetin dioxygenase-like cupin family protein